MPTTAEPSAGPQLEANKAIIRSFTDAWNTRDFDHFDALMVATATAIAERLSAGDGLLYRYLHG